MAFNGSGVFVRLYNWVNDAAAGIKIRADRMDNEMNGFATGLSTCITKDGQTTITANLPMATFRHTGVGNAAARTDYASFSQVQDGKSAWVDGGGTADAITAAYSIPITTLVDGQLCFVRATAANATTTPTFSPNSLTARTIVKNGGSSLVAGDIAGDGHELILRYDLTNTRWELMNPKVNVQSIPFTAASASGPASLDFAEDTDNGSNKVTLKAPASIASDAVLTMPGYTETLATLSGVETLLNKTLDETNTYSSFKLARNSAQFDSTSTTLANVTGLSVSVTAGTTYDFEANLLITASGANGIKLAIGGTCTATRMDAYAYGANGTGFAPLAQAPNVALGASIAAQTTAVTFAEIKGSIVVNTAGTLTVMFAQNTASGTSSVLIGSTFKVTKI